jgi:hypothetical protein
MNEEALLPIYNSTYFPVLSSGNEEPTKTLLGCEGLTFFALGNRSLAFSLMTSRGREWHLYGDVRWPSPSAWIEFPFKYSNNAPDQCGILVMIQAIPETATDPLKYAAENNPLMVLSPQDRGDDAVQQRLQLLNSLAVSAGNQQHAEDNRPAYVQSYCIFTRSRSDEPICIARYTDMLTTAGIPLPMYRMASTLPSDISKCQIALHTLFSINEARREGADVVAINQYKEFSPFYLAPDEIPPKWTQFNPSRVLRIRPRLRAIPTPTQIKDGMLEFSDYQRIMDL